LPGDLRIDQDRAKKNDMDDWLRVAAMVAIVVIGTAFILYVGMEWAAGM
jgi:hypothetical protein